MRGILAASRPFSWINTAFPFAAGYLLATGGRIDVAFVVGTLYFLGPYNLLMYGVNDVFDYASDLLNPRKGGIEGALADPATARAEHRRILWACAVTNVPLLVWLLALGGGAAGAVLVVVVFLVSRTRRRGCGSRNGRCSTPRRRPCTLSGRCCMRSC